MSEKLTRARRTAGRGPDKPLNPRRRPQLAHRLLRNRSYSTPVPHRGSDNLNNLAILREGQLVEEIALLYRKVLDGRNADDLRTKHAQTYLRELLKFKQESLALLRYQRAGKGARWEWHPELH